MSPIRFGLFELDLRSRELRKDGARVSLPGQSLQVLARAPRVRVVRWP